MLSVQNPPTTSATEATEKKKKAAPVVSEPRGELGCEEEEDDDDIPPLKLAPGLYRPLTGLPPELEAAHFSATASLSAIVAAAARNTPTAAAYAELIAAAHDLCRRMDADPQGGIATDDDYRKSLPEHIRNFVSPNLLPCFVFSLVTDKVFFSRPRPCMSLHNRWSSRREAKVPQKGPLDTLLEPLLRQIYPLIRQYFHGASCCTPSNIK